MVNTPKWPIDKIINDIKDEYKNCGIIDYWDGENESVKNAIEQISTKLPKNRYYFKCVLGVGGSGIVLRLKDNKFSLKDKAIKFPRPIPGKVDLISEMIKKEIAFLSVLDHPGIIKIYDYEIINNVEGYSRLPYYVMNFISGEKSNIYLNNCENVNLTLYSLLKGTIDIINYFHNSLPSGFVHLDIKPDNILVNQRGNPIIIDLGTCKSLRDDREQTIVACTLSFAHPQLVQKLQEDPSDANRVKGFLRHSQLKPEWDLWSYGLTILNWLGINFDDGSSKSNSIFSRIQPYDRKYYILLIARLLTYSQREWLSTAVGLSSNFIKEFAINSANEVLDILSRLDGSKSPLNWITNIKSKEHGTIQTGPRMHVPLTPALRKTLEHSSFRRLNSISQLGLVSQIYPGAKHSRREHSLGTYANTLSFLKILYNDTYSPLFRQIINENDCRDILLTSLIHDIGQFPLAHDLEEIDRKIFDHREITFAMLKGKWEKKKRGSKPIKFESLEPIFEAWGTTHERIENILLAKSSHTRSTFKSKLLRSILSGPIDADKLDYLLRDARYIDLPYPYGIDVDRLYKCLTVIVIKEYSGFPRDIPIIGVHAKGKVAAEFLALARYAMFSQAYWHHVVRSQKAMLLRAVKALLSLYDTEEKINKFKTEFFEMVINLPKSFYEPETLSLFPDERKPILHTFRKDTDLATTDAAVLSWFHKKLYVSERPECSLIEGILTRRLFKRLWVVSHEMEEGKWNKIVEAWDKLDRYKRHIVSIEFEKAISSCLKPEVIKDVTILDSTKAKEIINKKTAALEPWLLVDIPGPRPGSDIGMHYVLEGQRRQLRKDSRSMGDLKESTIWRNYAKYLRRATGKVRIFCEPMLVDTIESSLSWGVGVEILIDVLNELTME